VRGHGGQSATLLDEATLAAAAVLGDWSRQGVTDPGRRPVDDGRFERGE